MPWHLHSDFDFDFDFDLLSVSVDRPCVGVPDSKNATSSYTDGLLSAPKIFSIQPASGRLSKGMLMKEKVPYEDAVNLLDADHKAVKKMFIDYNRTV